MAKISAADIAARAQKLYGPKDRSRDIISTGADLKRPTKPEDFILCPPEHPWRALTGLQGLPFGYIIQDAGAPDSGKSTVAGEFMAFAQKQGVYVILWDTEGKFDSVRFTKYFHGDPKELAVVNTTILRKGAGAMLKFVRTIMEVDPSARILLVHDSVGGSVSRSRSERELDDEKNAQPATEAVENSDYMRAVVATFDKYPGRLALFLINQMTDRIGGVGRNRTGGHKISFHSSMILENTRVRDLTKVVKGVKVKTGIISKVKIAKNHLSLTENSVHEMLIRVDASGWHSADNEEIEEENNE